MRSTQFITNGYYHIYNRGVDKRPIFQRFGHYQRFLSTIRSILNTGSATERLTYNQGQALNSEEHQLARLITFFPEIVAAAAAELSPNVICTYLFQLAQTFNTFYQKHPILGEKHRLALTAATAQILKNGLYLLGISTVERM